MTLEELVNELRSALPAGLDSVVLYGSAATGDFAQGSSRYDLLVIAERLGPAELQAFAPALRRWSQAGQTAPMLFTRQQVLHSADAFPIEFFDIQQSRRVLYGEDLFAAVHADRDHLRRQLERELKGKLLALRSRYVLLHDEPRPLRQLMADSVSTFLVLFRAALRLYQADVPPGKVEALHALSHHIPFACEPLELAFAWHTGKKVENLPAVQASFADYLRTIEVIIDAVDHHIHQRAQESSV